MRDSKVYTTADLEWDRLVTRTPTPDIYFTAAYARIYERSYGPEIDEAFCGKAFLFRYGNQEEYVLYPFLLRRLETLEFLKNAKTDERGRSSADIVTPYGYTGILVRSHGPDGDLIKGFVAAFKEYCRAQGIVAGFTRFHPLLRNQELLRGQFVIEERGHTVFLDLRKDAETLFAEMDRKTRNLVRKAERNGVTIERSGREEDLQRFAKLYLGTMEKRDANRKYLFPLDFHQASAKLLGDDCSLFVARHEGKIISAAMFLHKYGFLHYHFSGSDPAYASLAPNNLLLWKVALWAKARGCTTMHLGGGLRPNDSLYHFKRGFSHDEAIFCTASTVYDEETYERLCAEKEEHERRQGGAPEKASFFPRYRAVTR